MFNKLQKINLRPKPFEFYTAQDLWNDPYTSSQMLLFHLNEKIDVSSRNRHFIEQSVDWIITQFCVDNTSRICDFGCGPGLYTAKLAKTGASVTGIDFSERSIIYAKNFANKNKLKINYIQQNYLTFQSNQKFDLITMIMCDFCALSPAQRKTLLTIFYQLLQNDGILLLDVYSLNAFQKREESAVYEYRQLNGFWSQNDYYGFMNTFKYQENKLILDKFTIFEKERTREIYNWLQYFSPDSLKAELEENGFKIVTLLGNLTGSPYSEQDDEFAVVVKKQ